MNPFDFILRAWRNQPLTPAERGVYRALKTLVLAAISAGVIAGIEYGHSRAIGQPFQTGSLVNAVLMAAGVSLAHGVAQWAQTHGDAPLADAVLRVALPTPPTKPVTIPSLPAPSLLVPPGVTVTVPAEDAAAQPTIPSLATVTGARMQPQASAPVSVSRASHPTLAAMVHPSATPVSADGRNATKDVS